MGSEVQFDNYYPMRDLNHDSNGISWVRRGENNLSYSGADKEFLKRKMLEHEAVFRSQVYELHRLYRVQKDLMDEVQKNEQNSHRTPFETSSSSSSLPPQMSQEDVQRRNSSSFLFNPPVSDTEYVPSATKGKSAHCPLIVNQNGVSPRNSSVYNARPSNSRKMIDLQLPPQEYMDADEIEQCKSALADLNEPLEPEGTNCYQNKVLLSKSVPSEALSWRPEHGNINGIPSNSHYSDKGNGQNWVLSLSKPEGSKDKGKSYHHQPGVFPANGNGSFEMLDTSSVSGFINKGQSASHIQSSVTRSNLIKSWDASWRNPSNYLNHMSTSVQKNPYLDSAGLSKSSQSYAPSNGFHEAWWSRNDRPRSKPGSGTETPVKNGFYHASFSRAGPDYLNSSYATSGSSNFLKGTNSFGLNSTGDLNLNVLDCSSNALAEKRDDSVSVLPWLAANKSEDRSTLDHQNSVASSSCSAKKILGVPIFEAQLSEKREKENEKKRLLFDINVPCDDPEEFEEIETAHPNNGHRNMIDLNSCFMEDEIHSESSHTNSFMKKAERGIIIDLETSMDLEDEDKQLALEAAEAIIDISAPTPPHPPSETSASENENALHWLADAACLFPDNDSVDYISSDSDSFEEMTLQLTECSVEEYFPNPPNFDALLAEEPGPAVNRTGRAGRGRARRGRHRCDFQRDILPGLTTLARNEVIEDLQMFGGLMRATGHEWHCGTRRNSSGRGRRKTVMAAPPPPPQGASRPPAGNATGFSDRKQIQKNGEIVIEDRSLTRWGKTTRRPKRQRGAHVAAGNPATIPLSLIT